jgi:hypothetical protein
MLLWIFGIRDFRDFFASDFSGDLGVILAVWGGNCRIGGALNALG